MLTGKPNTISLLGAFPQIAELEGFSFLLCAYAHKAFEPFTQVTFLHTPLKFEECQ
jgi:hypothetical protein